MDFNTLYPKLEQSGYYVFSSANLLSFDSRENKAALEKSLYRWRKKGWIFPLKKGLYELAYPKDFLIPDLYIANRLYEPSYVSLETALSHYSIIPEVSMAVTSITTKPTRRFKNKHGLFLYRTVQPAAFTGYFVEKINGFDVRLAEPEKALVDFLYFKTYRGQPMDFKEERLDYDVISRLKRKRLDHYAALYDMSLKEFYAYLKRID